jgi:hypothetical protein
MPELLLGTLNTYCIIPFWTEHRRYRSKILHLIITQPKAAARALAIGTMRGSQNGKWQTNSHAFTILKTYISTVV